MTSNKEIQNELLSLSPTLAAIPAINVFRVPDNYFNELSSNVLQLLQSDITPSFGTAGKSTLAVPEGYFDGLAASILSKIKNEVADTVKDEISHISPVIAQIGNQQVFSVPDGYFDSISSTVLSKLNTQAFQTAGEEINSLSPVIAAIGNMQVFTVPEGYFDNISSEALKNVAPQAKVVEMKKRSGLIRYMAAAAVAGVIGLSIFNLAGKSSKINKNNDQTELFAQVNDILKNNSFDKEMNSLSDKDIEDYLKANGEDVDAALVASTAAADESSLPAPEEYIIDDNTLDNFLKKVNLNN